MKTAVLRDVANDGGSPYLCKLGTFLQSYNSSHSIRQEMQCTL
jgi:hypothetical protein